MKDKLIDILFGILLILALFIGALKIIYEIREFKIDHECYMMPDEQFFKEEKCKPYWEYRNDR